MEFNAGDPFPQLVTFPGVRRELVILPEEQLPVSAGKAERDSSGEFAGNNGFLIAVGDWVSRERL